MPLHARLQAVELRDRWHELLENGARARHLTGHLTADQFWWRPAEDRWSVGECLDHLVLAGEAYLRVLDPAITRARLRERIARRPTRRSLLGNVLVRGVEPPPRLRIPAPKSIRPRRPADPAAEPAAQASAPDGPLHRFLDLRDRYARRLGPADGLALGRVRVRSPFVPLVSVNLDIALRIITSHERRHLHQLEQVLAAPGFPHGAAAAAAT